jgi:hypothetical protein
MKSKETQTPRGRALNAHQLEELLRHLEELQKHQGWIQWPEKKIVDAIVRERKLKPDQAVALQRTFNVIQAFMQPIDSLERQSGQYQTFKRTFERLEKQLARLRSDMSKNILLIDHFVGEDLFSVLRPIVSPEIAVHLDGVAVGIFLEIVDALNQAVSKRVSVNKANKGGKPRIWPRDVILEMLARDALLIIGTRATATINGPFEKLCGSVLENLGMSTRGLSEAIAEKLVERRLRAKEEPRRGRRK